MSQYLKNLAIYFAKKLLHFFLTLLVVVAIIFMFANVAHCQKKEGEANPTQSLSPIALHKKLHKGQDWWTWMSSDNIKLSEKPSATNTEGGDFFYTSFSDKDEKKIFTLNWNIRTLFSVSEKEGEDVSLKGKCFFVVFCKNRKHNLALTLEEQKCSLLENKTP